MDDQATGMPPGDAANQQNGKQTAGQDNNVDQNAFKPLPVKQLLITLHRQSGQVVQFSVRHHPPSFASALQCLLVMNPSWFLRFTIADGETREILLDCDMPSVAKAIIPMLPQLPDQQRIVGAAAMPPAARTGRRM